MPEIFKPLLAGKPDFATLRFPLLASVKIDGLRCIIRDSHALSRSQKLLPNRYLQQWAMQYADLLEGMDGELVIGPITADDCYRRSVSGIMSEDGEPDFTFWAFDFADMPNLMYQTRFGALMKKLPVHFPRVRVLPQTRLHTQADVDEFEANALAQGHEGIMLRDPTTLYKQGRATSKGQELLKVKRFEDAEAIVVGVEEEMHNGNQAEVNELGRTKRSSHQDNKSGKGTLGALVVKGLTAYAGIEFKIGTGFDAEMRQNLWKQDLVGKVAKFKHFPVGAKDAPRHPVFLGWRDPKDMETAA